MKFEPDAAFKALSLHYDLVARADPPPAPSSFQRVSAVWHSASGSREALQRKAWTARRFPPFFDYKDKGPPRSTAKRRRQVDWDPLRYLSPYEVREHHRLSGRKRLYEARATDKARSRLDELARGVAWRAFGIERFMVLRVQCLSGHELRLMVEQVTFAEGRTAWRVGGRALRKDGTIGVRPDWITFTEARIWRRRLDGLWQLLQPKLHLWTNPRAYSNR